MTEETGSAALPDRVAAATQESFDAVAVAARLVMALEDDLASSHAELLAGSDPALAAMLAIEGHAEREAALDSALDGAAAEAAARRALELAAGDPAAFGPWLEAALAEHASDKRLLIAETLTVGAVVTLFSLLATTEFRFERGADGRSTVLVHRRPLTGAQVTKIVAELRKWLPWSGAGG